MAHPQGDTQAMVHLLVNLVTGLPLVTGLHLLDMPLLLPDTDSSSLPPGDMPLLLLDTDSPLPRGADMALLLVDMLLRGAHLLVNSSLPQNRHQQVLYSNNTGVCITPVW